ncbi:MAG TPA: hypothetical protein VG841_14215 [Caulobacterales bacterium]|nr:hypothetical protein [Caulobacterales bacterium]
MRGFRSIAFLLAGALLFAPLAMAQSARPVDAAKLRAPAARLQVQQATTVTATPAPTDQQPVTVVVPANVEWMQTPVAVQSGGRLQIRAGDGRWSLAGQTAAARAERLTTNADGFNERTNPQAMSPGSNLGALIGKIGANGAPFLVGSKYDAAAAGDGPLFLAINDQPGGYADNAGRMPVSIVFTPPPPPPSVDQGGEVPGAAAPSGAPTTAETGTETSDVPEIAPDQPQAGQPAAASPAPQPAALPEWAVPVGVAALLIAAILLWPRAKPSAKGRRAPRNAPRAGVTTRIVSDGRAAQQLSVRWRDRK